MLDIFVNITEAITLPDLKEYYWRNDKVADLLGVDRLIVHMHITILSAPMLMCKHASLC